jgi:hypothetical protein
MDDLVLCFREYGISKDQTDKILAEFATLLPTDDQQAQEPFNPKIVPP